MRHSWCLLLFLALGCQVVHGPKTGHGYPLSVGMRLSSWRYYQECREFYVEKHPELPAAWKAAILEGRVLKGMGKDEVRAALGNLEGHSYTISHEFDEAGTSREVWCYIRFASHEYVTFADGKVIAYR